MLLFHLIVLAIGLIPLRFQYETCEEEISWYFFLAFGVYIVGSLVFEAQMFIFCYQHISHLIPIDKPNCSRKFPNNIINSAKAWMLKNN